MPREQDVSGSLAPGPRHPPEVVAKQLPPAQPVQPRHPTFDSSTPLTRPEPVAPQNAWSKKSEDREDTSLVLRSSQDNLRSSSGKAWDQEVSRFEQYDTRGSQAMPARNSAQEWPIAQQAPTQPQRANIVTYGGANAGSVQSGRTGGRNAGKKEMASKGFVTPIQITRMGWGDPLPNAQDTWGEEEPAPQPLASAMPAAGKPSKRRPAPAPPAFPPMPEVQDDLPDQQSSAPARHVQPQPTMHWQRMWTTDALDHIGDEVRACLHVTKMPDLVDENGGAGKPFHMATEHSPCHIQNCTNPALTQWT